jgi:signal transduction histidine kinase
VYAINCIHNISTNLRTFFRADAEYKVNAKDVGKGTGLGLQIALQIVIEKHNGSLEVQSE